MEKIFAIFACFYTKHKTIKTFTPLMAKSTKSKIVVPIDFSEQSIIALGQSYNLAREYNAEILLLHVMEAEGILPKMVTVKHLNAVKRNIQKRLNKLAEDASKKGNIAVDTMIAK